MTLLYTSLHGKTNTLRQDNLQIHTQAFEVPRDVTAIVDLNIPLRLDLNFPCRLSQPKSSYSYFCPHDIENMDALAEEGSKPKAFLCNAAAC